MELKNKVALILGGARMGETVAQAFASKGCHVILSYRRSRKSAEMAANAVRNQGLSSWVVQCNAAVESDLKKLSQWIQKKIGRLDIVVNMSSTYRPILWTALNGERFTEQIDNNLKAAFLTVLHLSPMLKKSGGRVVHFSDWICASGRPRYKNFVPYYAAKSGVIGLAQAQALELAPKVLVNVIAPGPIIPPKGATNVEIKRIIQETPLRFWGGPTEIAKAVLFFCESNFVTGECLRVDGGRHLY